MWQFVVAIPQRDRSDALCVEPLHRYVVTIWAPLFRGRPRNLPVAQASLVLVHEHAKEQCQGTECAHQGDEPFFHLETLASSRSSNSRPRATESSRTVGSSSRAE